MSSSSALSDLGGEVDATNINIKVMGNRGNKEISISQEKLSKHEETCNSGEEGKRRKVRNVIRNYLPLTRGENKQKQREKWGWLNEVMCGRLVSSQRVMKQGLGVRKL